MRPLLRVASAICLAVVMPASGVRAQDGEGAAFRPACELIGAEGIAGLVGKQLSPSALGPQSCAWDGAGPSVFVTLDENGGVAINRLVLPDVADVSVAGREAVSSPGGDGMPATVIVALDEGGILRVQVVAADGIPADPLAAGVSIAEAIFEGGPVLARPPNESSGPALGYEGDICELVTLAEMKGATGTRKFATAEPDGTGSCTYGSRDFSLLVTVGFAESELFQYRGEGSDDLTVGGLPAVWSTQFFNTLVVDVGGGRLLQVALLAMDGRPRQLQEAAAAIADIAVARLVPVVAAAPATAAPAGPGCDLLPVEQVASITGLPFAVASDEGVTGTGCSYSTVDPANAPYFLVVSRIEGEDPAAVVDMLGEGLDTLPDAESVEVATHPGLIAADETLAFVAVDLDALAGHEGEVLGVLWLFPPADTDSAAMLLELAETAIAGL